MTLLLDTHAFLWFNADDARLSALARETISSAQEPAVSIASLWEIAIKLSIGKLKLDTPFVELVLAAQEQAFSICPVQPKHLLTYTDLKHHHRDPFDRMLVAQAITAGVPIVSSDSALDAYGVERIW